MPVSPRQLYKVKVIGELHGQYTQNEFWFRGGDSSPASTVQAEITGINNDFRDQIIPLIKNFASQEWYAKTMLTVQMSASPGIFIDNVLTGNGIQLEHSLPSFCGGVLSLRCGLTGRSRIGRLYIPGVAEDRSSLSRLEGDYLAILQTLGSTLLGRYGPTGTVGYGRIGVFSRLLGVSRIALPTPHLLYSTAGWTQITAFIARNEIGTIRKRKLARGQ